MAQSVNVKFAKCFIVFMAVVILVEGAAYLGLSIWGITLHDCAGDNSDPVNRPFEFVLDLVYFSSEKCGAPELFVEAINMTVPMNIDFSVAEVVSNREFIFLITYTVISALWIVTSLFVLVTICGAVTKLVEAVCFWPWFLVIMAGSILDVVATGYHIHDIFHTTSANSTFEYVGVEQVDVVTGYLQDYDIYFITPAVAFTCISSRVVLIWLLNIFGAIFCLSLAKVLSANSSMKKNDQLHRLPVDTAVPAQPQRQMQEIQQQDTVVLRYQPTAPPETLRDRRTLEPLKIPQDQSPQIEVLAYPPVVARQQSTTKNKRISELKTQASINTDTPTYQSSDAHPANLDYPSRNGTVSSQPSVRSATPELSAISPLNMRYSTPDGPAFPSQPHVTQELRGQLPWSYTNIMNDPIAQKRIQSHLQPDDEEFPSIPAPDYTMHHPKKDRSQVNPDRLSQTGYSRW